MIMTIMESSQDPNNAIGIATEMSLMAMSTSTTKMTTTSTTATSTPTTLTCKVQYMNDIDPFSACTKFPEPTRPPLFTFNVNQPLIKQIAAVHRLLNAPHRVCVIIIIIIIIQYLCLINNHHYPIDDIYYKLIL